MNELIHPAFIINHNNPIPGINEYYKHISYLTEGYSGFDGRTWIDSLPYSKVGAKQILGKYGSLVETSLMNEGLIAEIGSGSDMNTSRSLVDYLHSENKLVNGQIYCIDKNIGPTTSVDSYPILPINGTIEETLPLFKKTFDLVFSVWTQPYIADIYLVLGQIFNSLKVNGTGIIHSPASLLNKTYGTPMIEIVSRFNELQSYEAISVHNGVGKNDLLEIHKQTDDLANLGNYSLNVMPVKVAGDLYFADREYSFF